MKSIVVATVLYMAEKLLDLSCVWQAFCLTCASVCQYVQVCMCVHTCIGFNAMG